MGIRKENINWSARFFVIITILLQVVGIRYLTTYSIPKEPVAVLYTLSAYISQMMLFTLAPWIISFLFSILIPSKKVVKTISVVTAAILIATVLLDTLLFAQNRFHLGLLTIAILGVQTWGFWILYFVIATVFTSKLNPICEKPFKKSLGKFVKIAFPLIFVISTVATHFIHAVADSRYYSPITRFTTQLPLFYPTTARRFMVKHGLADLEAIRANRDFENIGHGSNGDLNYPVAPLEYDKEKRSTNLLLIVFDGLRADMISDKTTPNLMKFARENQQYMNHISGGNSTRMGVFSLFYGIPSTYWQSISGIQMPSIFVEEFRNSGYDLALYGSHTFAEPASLDRTAFSKIRDLRMETVDGDQPFEKDQNTVRDWLLWEDNRDSSELFFSFLFFDNPVAQSVSQELEMKVKDQSLTGESYKKEIYRVAVHQSDSLLGIVLEQLEESNLLENTTVIITSDHGEEFDERENGFTGHGTGYSDHQINIPLIVSTPNDSSQEISKRTSHPDIVATIMKETLHCTNDSRDYCSGIPLSDENQWDWRIVGSYYNHAIVEANQVTISYPGGYFEVRDSTYSVVSNRNINRENMKEALAEMSRFYK